MNSHLYDSYDIDRKTVVCIVGLESIFQYFDVMLHILKYGIHTWVDYAEVCTHLVKMAEWLLSDTRCLVEIGTHAWMIVGSTDGINSWIGCNTYEGREWPSRPTHHRSPSLHQRRFLHYICRRQHSFSPTILKHSRDPWLNILKFFDKLCPDFLLRLLAILAGDELWLTFTIDM